MINKILVFGGLALMAILLVENMVVPRQAFVFISSSSTTWMLTLTSTIIWVLIWVGIANIINTEPNRDDDLNF